MGVAMFAPSTALEGGKIYVIILSRSKSVLYGMGVTVLKSPDHADEHSKFMTQIGIFLVFQLRDFQIGLPLLFVVYLLQFILP